MAARQVRRRLPPLGALRAFEAAARHLSFTRAADELLVTQGAISRQIRSLEEFLGEPVFQRLTRRVELTPAGARYYGSIARSLDEIQAATLLVKGEGKRPILRISVLPSIASFWLMPRLAAFSQAQNEAELRVVSSVEPVDFRVAGIDLAVRVGKLPGASYPPHLPRIEMDMVADWQGVRSELLFPDVLTPVCARGLPSPSGAWCLADLARVRLIHVTTRRYAWEDWLRGHGAGFDADRDALHFGHFFMALEAARAGHGVAIVPTIVLRHYDHADQMMRPFAADLPSAGSYHLLFHESRAAAAPVRMFRRWVTEQAAQETALEGYGVAASTSG